MRKSVSAKNLLKTEGIITCNPSDTLAQALAKLNSSHDAVFVVNEKDKLIGVISPYHVLFQNNFPSTTKVKNCVYSPPKIRENTNLWQIARNMMESKVYYLPVFSQNDKWLGIVSVKSLLREIAKDKSTLKKLDITKKRTMITLTEDSNLKDARKLFNTKKVSRLPIVNHQGRLVGIITRYDIRDALSQAKSSQRFLSRVGEKKKSYDKPIRGFYKKSVITATEKTPLSKMISIMLEKDIGSIVIVGNRLKPQGILTTKDFLKAISSKGQQRQVTLEVSVPNNFKYESELMKILKKLLKKLVKRVRIKRIEVILKKVKNPAGKTKLFKASFIAYLVNHAKKIGEGEDHEWKKAVQKASARIERQLMRHSK